MIQSSLFGYNSSTTVHFKCLVTFNQSWLITSKFNRFSFHDLESFHDILKHFFLQSSILWRFFRPKFFFRSDHNFHWIVKTIKSNSQAVSRSVTMWQVWLTSAEWIVWYWKTVVIAIGMNSHRNHNKKKMKEMWKNRSKKLCCFKLNSIAAERVFLSLDHHK